MRPATWTGATLLALALGGTAFTEDKPAVAAKAKDAPAPGSFADAKVGDWATYAIDMKRAHGSVIRTVAVFRVAAVRADAVDLIGTAGANGPELRRTHPKGRDLTSALGALVGDDFARDNTPVADELTLDGHKFKCLRFDKRPGADAVKASLWLSAEVKVFGLVQATMVEKNGSGRTITLTGMGTVKETLFGKKP